MGGNLEGIFWCFGVSKVILFAAIEEVSILYPCKIGIPIYVHILEKKYIEEFEIMSIQQVGGLLEGGCRMKRLAVFGVVLGVIHLFPVSGLGIVLCASCPSVVLSCTYSYPKGNGPGCCPSGSYNVNGSCRTKPTGETQSCGPCAAISKGMPVTVTVPNTPITTTKAPSSTNVLSTPHK